MEQETSDNVPAEDMLRPFEVCRARFLFADDPSSGTLIPDASNSELKDLLQTGLKLFEMHQMHAEQLAGKIAGKNTAALK